MEILKKAQQFIEFLTLSLEDEEDPVPFIIILDERDKQFFSGFTEIPGDPEGKDRLADIIMALCIAQGAVAAVFGSSVWFVEPLTKEDAELPPSQNPRRKEAVIVSAADSTGVNTVWIAPVIREAGKVGVGLWEQLSLDAAGGRFAEALHMGVKLSSKMPTEVRDYLREQIEAGLMDEIVTSTANVITEARRTAMTIERGVEK